MSPKCQSVISSLNSSTTIAYSKSTSIAIQLRNSKNFGQQCRCHSRSSRLCPCHVQTFSYVPVLPDSFLGGSAPRLRYFHLDAVQFLRLPKLLLSSTHLVCLYLQRIPHSGYISPETMATCLSMLTSLMDLRLEFESPESSPDQEGRRSPSITCSVLPDLTYFSFKGVNEYLEDFVARIDAPQLYYFPVTFFNDLDFDTPELIRFVSRSLRRPEAPIKAHVSFDSQTASVELRPQASGIRHFSVNILCREPG